MNVRSRRRHGKLRRTAALGGECESGQVFGCALAVLAGEEAEYGVVAYRFQSMVSG
jgi:hypothetical protein